MVAFKNRAVITCPGHSSRQGEVDSIKKVLGQLGLDVWDMREMDSSALCDGGDVLNTGRHMFVGLSDRTNSFGAGVLEEVFGGDKFPVISVQSSSSVSALAVEHVFFPVASFVSWQFGKPCHP